MHFVSYHMWPGFSGFVHSNLTVHTIVFSNRSLGNSLDPQHNIIIRLYIATMCLIPTNLL